MRTLSDDGDPFETIAAVRAGTVKTYVADCEGREQVLAFIFRER